jgi:5'-3' exonuclease
MGIPSYFAQVIKSNAHIVEPAARVLAREAFHALYMDCNSVIYDAVHFLEAQPARSLPEMERAIIARVLDVIASHIAAVRPSRVAFISFDGVAPMAKMDQQRTRRYKSSFVESIDFGDKLSEAERLAKFSTAAITPGTAFMAALSIATHLRFQDTPGCIVSASEIAGEGEHKMFAHMRDTAGLGDTVAVYGLDADLIMLSLAHRARCRNIFIFREAPAFIGSILPGAEPNSLYFLDIGALGKDVAANMGGARPAAAVVQDYIFMCFMLGNDFLPHFPALNIRTQGIEVLESLYRRVISSRADRGFIKNERIQWRWVAHFIDELAKMEHGLILKEYQMRAKFTHRTFRETTPSERKTAMENSPILFRGTELFIAPKEPWWESRYYSALLHIPREDAAVKEVCMNYLEGLEWTWRYYVSPCPSWKWRYRYAYPPLLCDLANYVPRLDTEFVRYDDTPPVHPNIQLAYVIPRELRRLLPKGVKDLHPPPYPSAPVFQWAFCRYFWECHALLPELPPGTLFPDHAGSARDEPVASYRSGSASRRKKSALS